MVPGERVDILRDPTDQMSDRLAATPQSWQPVQKCTGAIGVWSTLQERRDRGPIRTVIKRVTVIVGRTGDHVGSVTGSRRPGRRLIDCLDAPIPDKALAERSLHEFFVQSWRITTPGSDLCDGWHLEAMEPSTWKP